MQHTNKTVLSDVNNKKKIFKLRLRDDYCGYKRISQENVKS